MTKYSVRALASLRSSSIVREASADGHAARAGLGRQGRLSCCGATRRRRMLEAATPLPTVSAVLGHADPDSTRVYAAHRGGMLACVLPDTGGSSIGPTEPQFVTLAGGVEEYIRFRRPWAGMAPIRSCARSTSIASNRAVRLEQGVVERWMPWDRRESGVAAPLVLVHQGLRQGGCDYFVRRVRALRPVEGRIPRPTPCLLTDREAALFLQTGTLESPSPWAWQSRAFFMLMACCGLRTREVRRLAVGHVDHKARSVGVVDSAGAQPQAAP